jgi:hypothetical protein
VFERELTTACTAVSLHNWSRREPDRERRIVGGSVTRVVDAYTWDHVSKHRGEKMDTTTLLVIVLVVLALGGGGFFYRRRGV